jgi:signal transduction histidine kinase
MTEQPAAGDPRPPTLRRLAALSLTALGLLTLVSLGALVGGSSALQRAMETVTRDTRSAALANELEAAVLMHQRLSNLHVATGETQLDIAREASAAEIRHLLVRAGEFVAAEEEQQILDSVSTGLDSYLEERRQAEQTPGLRLGEVVQLARPAFRKVLADLRALREMNDAQIQRARAESARISRLATLVGASAAAMLMAAFVVIGWGVSRYLLRPVVALHQTIARFRDGDLDDRAGASGVREVDELARMFNDMAISLSQQRKAQLTFLAGVAHDLKNPLSTLKTGMYTLEHEASEVRRGNTRATLDRQVDLLNRMVDDLLDATRIEAGQLELRWATFDLRRLVNDVVRLYVPTAPEHQITSRIPDEPVMVEADGLRIEQVLRNLVSNAIKFSPYGGSVEVALERGSNEVALSVSDRGIGIPRDEHTSIFLPFRRRDLNVAPGAGLGLSVVRRIVSAHGGSIDVESEPGAGSTFRVRLPLARNNARGTAADVP